MSSYVRRLVLLQERIQDKLEGLIRPAASQYNRARKDSGLPCGDRDTWHEGTAEGVSDGGLVIAWEETWRYGGYDQGFCTIPLEALDPETRDECIRSLIQAEKEKVAAHEAAKQEAREVAERLELARLQAKYAAPESRR